MQDTPYYPRLYPFVIWLAYLLILLWMTMPQGTRSLLMPEWACAPAPCEPVAMKPLSTSADAIRIFGQADPGAVARKARLIVETKDWAHLSMWPDWPPGMILIQTALYRISPAAPLGLALAVITCSLWACVLTQLSFLAFAWRWSRLGAFLLPLFLTLCHEFNYLTHLGLFYTESLSIAFFLLGVGSVFRAVPLRNLKAGLLAGLYFALSSYMRAQTDLVMTVAFLLLIACVAGAAWSHFHRVSLRTVKQTFAGSAMLAVLGVALLTYQGLILPYKAAHHFQLIDFSENAMWHAAWQRPDEMGPGLQFYVDGGALAGCKLDPVRCEDIHARREAAGREIYTNSQYLHFTLASWFEHPLDWIAFKGSYLLKFWFDGSAESVLLTMLIPILLLYGARKGNYAHEAVSFLLLATLAGVAGPLMLTHVEPRYLYELKMTILYAAFLLLINAARPASSDE